MEIAQADAISVVGTIQSVTSFAPPFTVTAVVTATVANGHQFVFGITSANAGSGPDPLGNLNPRDCSNETNCGNQATCGNPANPSVGPNQCFYGVYAPGCDRRQGLAEGDPVPVPIAQLERGLYTRDRGR